MDYNFSILEQARLKYTPKTPALLQDLSKASIETKQVMEPKLDVDKLKSIFIKTFSQPFVEISSNIGNKIEKPMKIGVVFSGGQAAGGHNVISGLFDAIDEACPNGSQLLGFMSGPSGIVDNKTMVITKEIIDNYRNMGGFDLIGSGRTKIETNEQLAAAKETAEKLQLDGIVVVGGDDSNTNAALLAEFFMQNGCSTKVIGVPKTIDGDLQNEFIEISFGFDTATKVYSEMIGNLQRDALSAKKYYHFIKLMGRSASHIALECALKTHPNITIIGEEVKAKKMTLRDVVHDLADTICARSENDKNYGIVLIPEGVIEFIPEVEVLIQELNALLSSDKVKTKTLITSVNSDEKAALLKGLLSKVAYECYISLPEKLQTQLLFDRDPHGNIQVSQIETEKLLTQLIEQELQERKNSGKYKGKFNPLHHFFGYEGRCSMPSNFDAQYCYSLGRCAFILIANGLTGYMSCVYNICDSVDKWKARGLPLVSLMNMEKRSGIDKPVIKKALVDLEGKSFKDFTNNRGNWANGDDYTNPGPIQFFGDIEITDTLPLTL
jgi:diphosphate-dependent phosphofructokinase